MKSRTESFIGKASESDISIALYYKDSADILYNSKAYQDRIVLPYLFLVRQFLELGLKYNIKKLAKVSGCDNLLSTLNKEHGLKTIHNAFIVHYEGAKDAKIELKDSELFDKKYLISLNELVDKISVHDNNSQGFRYSEDIKNKKIIKHNEKFNLKEISDLLEDSKNILANIDEVFGLS